MLSIVRESIASRTPMFQLITLFTAFCVFFFDGRQGLEINVGDPQDFVLVKIAVGGREDVLNDVGEGHGGRLTGGDGDCNSTICWVIGGKGVFGR